MHRSWGLWIASVALMTTGDGSAEGKPVAFAPSPVLIAGKPAGNPAAGPENPASVIIGKNIPGLDLKLPDLAQCTGVKFGEKPEEIVYLVFSAKHEPRERKTEDGTKEKEPIFYDTMYAYAPSLPEFKQPKSFKGQVVRRPAGTRTVECIEYQPVRLTTMIGKSPATVQIDIVLHHTRRTRQIEGTAEFQIQQERVRSRMVVNMDILPSFNLEAPIKEVVLMEPPMLEIRLMDGARRIVANLRSGKERSILPVQGPIGEVYLEVLDGPRVILTKKMAPDKKGFPDKDVFEIAPGRLAPGKTYLFRVKSNMGPWGSLKAEQSLPVASKGGSL